MKKLLVSLLALLLVAGCTAKKEEVKEEVKTEMKAEETTTTAIAKVGSGSVTHVKAGELNDEGVGKFSFTTTYAIVAVDAEGKIVDLRLDVAKTDTTYDKEGMVNELEKEVLSKGALKADYGMAKASAIGKEWFEQAAAFEEFAKGKTVAELTSLALEEDKATAEELKTSVTVKIADWLKAVEKAGANLNDVEGAVSIAAGQKTSTTVKEATDEKGASFAVNTTMTFIALDAEGKLVYTNIDVAQSSAGLTKEMTTTLTEDVKTKKEKGAEYGMAKASPIGKEWFEQAEALEAYALGKKADEVASLELEEVNNRQVLKAEEFKTSVTMGVDEIFLSLLDAAKNVR